MRRLFRVCLPSRLLLTGVIFAVPATSPALAATHPEAINSAARAIPSVKNYDNLPLAFEANRGQANDRVKFLARSPGYSLFLTDSGALLSLGRGRCVPDATKSQSDGNSCHATRDMIRMTLDGTPNQHVVNATGEAQLPGKVNYFLGNNPAKWQTDLPTYARVRMSEIYPGIDLVYYGNGRQLEYDFVVAPGVSPAPIRLSFDGQKHLSIAPNGDLVLEGAYGFAAFHKPVIYQQSHGKRQAVAGTFRLTTASQISFAVGSYDHTQPLIIDPVLVYASYLGGSGADGNGDVGNDIAVDSGGNAYVVGMTTSTDLPITAGSFQSKNNAPTSGQSYTVFVTKFNATGTALIYSTYLGGTGGDVGYGIALDAMNNAYLTGTTYSADFPITCGAFQTANAEAAINRPTAFVAKLNAAGSGLLYSTYLGGSGNANAVGLGDTGQAIAVKGTNAYVTGHTVSIDFPTTDTAFQTKFAASGTASNAFVTAVSSDGTSLVYSTYLGGAGSNGTGDIGNAIVLDSAGDAFVAGSTASPNFPVTSGVVQASLTASTNAFITELNPTGDDLIYSTYLGGTGGDSATAITVDGSGFAYVGGTTYSSDFPLTDRVVESSSLGLGAYLSAGINGGAFVSKLSKDGSALEYSTYFEGLSTTINGLTVDSSGNLYLTGNAPWQGNGTFGGFQTTPDALSIPASNQSAAYLVKLDPDATVFEYATLFGGSNLDGANAIAMNGPGNIYLTGVSNSPDLPATSGAYQTKKTAAGLKSDAFVASFSLTSETNQTTYPGMPSNVATTLVALGNAQITLTCYGEGSIPSDAWSMSVGVWLTANNGPSIPPTGTISFWDESGNYDYADPYVVSVLQPPGSGLQFGFTDGESYDAPTSPFSVYWYANYSGDAVYAPSSTSGTVSSPGCPPPPDFRRPLARQGNASRVPLQPSTIHGNGPSQLSSHPISTRLSRLGPKFILPPAVLHGTTGTSSAMSYTWAQDTPACLAPSLLPLSVTVQPVSRLYGAPNPTFTYMVAGLLNGDTVQVAPQTTATASSPVGMYPITATVTGPATANYKITVNSAMLTVTPASLAVTVQNETHYAGAADFLYPYTIAGLVNGDTVTVVAQAAVTPWSPPGSYPITATVTGAALSNYALTVVPGTLQIIPRPLPQRPIWPRQPMTQGPQPSALPLTVMPSGSKSKLSNTTADPAVALPVQPLSLSDTPLSPSPAAEPPEILINTTSPAVEDDARPDSMKPDAKQKARDAAPVAVPKTP